MDLYGEIESKHQEILQVVAKQSGHLEEHDRSNIDLFALRSRQAAGAH